MPWIVEAQAKSGLGQTVWLKTAGPFDSKPQADLIADRTGNRTGLPTRVTEAPR